MDATNSDGSVTIDHERNVARDDEVTIDHSIAL